MTLGDLALAERCARAAGDVLMSYYERPAEGLGAKSSDTDPVSDADREAERVIRELLAAERPDDGLLAEEGSSADAVSGRRWLVDPLDGTVNFLYGFHAWAVSVALEDAEGLKVGVVLDPVRDELFGAERGAGAFLERPDASSSSDGAPGGGNGLSGRSRKRIQVSGCDDLARAMVATGFSYVPERRAEQAERLLAVLPRVRDIRRAGSAALDLCFVASGRVDVFYERGLNAWDEAAGRLIVAEAGGTVGDLPGEPRGVIAAATPELRTELEALVA